MPEPIRKLDDFLPDNMKGSLYRMIKDVFNQPMVIRAVSFTKDDRGYKATITAVFLGQNDVFYVVTRAAQPLSALSYAVKNKMLPFAAKFCPQGQSVLLIDPDKEPPEQPEPDLPL